MSSVQQQIKEFVLQNYLFTSDAAALADNASLTQEGIIDSTGALELILFLEERFGLKVDDDEMTPDNLDSVDKIASYVTRKMAA
jgi:acyl carrier protein